LECVFGIFQCSADQANDGQTELLPVFNFAVFLPFSYSQNLEKFDA